jgi:transcriptional regulator with XRE-family HTH domain
MPNTLASRLKRAREARGIGVVDLGLRVGMSRGFVSEIERGKTQKLLAETAIKLADELGVRVQWLVMGRGPMAEPAPPAAEDSTPTPELSDEPDPPV